MGAMKVTIRKIEKVEIDIPIPSYWHNGLRHIAILEENNALTFATYADQVELKNMTGLLLQSYLADTQEPNSDYKQITEDEFLEAYDKAMETLSFNPIAKTW